MLNLDKAPVLARPALFGWKGWVKRFRQRNAEIEAWNAAVAARKQAKKAKKQER